MGCTTMRGTNGTFASRSLRVQRECFNSNSATCYLSISDVDALNITRYSEYATPPMFLLGLVVVTHSY